MRHPLMPIAWTATLGLLAVAPARGQVEDDPQFAARHFVMEHAGEDGVLSLEETKAALADIELSVVVDRELQAADYRLEVLRHHLEERLEDLEAPDPDLVEAATLGLVAHVELQLARGYVDDAWNELEPPPTVAEGGQVPPDVAAELAIWNDPRVVELRALVARRRGGPGPRGPADGPSPEDAPLVGLRVQGDRIEEVVRSALERVQPKLVLELGAPAAPALAKLVEEELDVLPERYDRDPLYLLVGVDAEEAGRVVLRNRDGGGFFWKKRVARALDENRAFAWVDPGQARYAGRYSYPTLLKVIEWLVDDPDVGDDVLPHLTSIVQLGAFTPSLQDTLARALVSDSPVRRHAALALLQQADTHEKLRPILEPALASADPEVRIRAAQTLVNLGWSDALLAHVDDPESQVRGHLSRMLTLHMTESRGSVHPPDTPEHRAAVEHLLADPDAEIRAQAVFAIRYFPTRRVEVPDFEAVERVLHAPPLAALLPLATDPGMRVRQGLAALCQMLDPELAVPLLTVLVGDEDENVVGAASEAIASLDVRAQPEQALEVLRARRANEHQPFAATPWQVIHRFAFPRGRELFARWVIEAQDSELVEAFLTNLANPDARGDAEATVASLAPDTLAGLLRAVDRFPGSAYRVVDLLGGVPEGSREAMLGVAGDIGASSRLRAFAAVAGAGEDRSRWLPALHAALRDPWWKDQKGLDRGEGRALRALVDRMAYRPLEDSNALALALVRDPAVHDDVAAFVAERSDVRAPGGVELNRAVLARWFEGKRGAIPTRVVRAALTNMAAAPALRDDARIARAIDDPTLAHAAIDAIASLRDPALMPLLAKVIREKVGSNYWFEAAQATATFLSDEAAELLLEAAALTDDATERSWCMTELERIREYHVARDYWRRSKAVERARDEAVGELMALLDDPDEAVRVQAVRGLGTFKAVEAIPTLIRLMKSASPTVRKEIEQALERINAGDAQDEDG